MIITLTNRQDGKRLINSECVVSVARAGASSAWHGTNAFVRTTDGKVHEVEQTVDQIEALLAKGEPDG